MNFLLSILVGMLCTAAVYLLLHRDFVKLVIGIVILGHAAVLFIYAAGRIVRDSGPFVSRTGLPPEVFADPVPQALILTALVIGFGIQAFALLLFKKVYEIPDVDEIDDLKK